MASHTSVFTFLDRSDRTGHQDTTHKVEINKLIKNSKIKSPTKESTLRIED